MGMHLAADSTTTATTGLLVDLVLQQVIPPYFVVRSAQTCHRVPIVIITITIIIIIIVIAVVVVVVVAVVVGMLSY